MGFDDETKRMVLLETQPGVSVDQVLAETGFELLVPDRIGKNAPPSAEELRILRQEVDRDRLDI
jgi:glutaconate CoA-transferase subunit B